MKQLQALVASHDADTRPADAESIKTLGETLGFGLSAEYKDYLSTFGVIAYDAYETFGLGVSENSHLNVLNNYADLSTDPTYPPGSVPLLELGDGHYFLYDNASGQVILWATPNGGIVRVVDEGLEAFLAKRIFDAS